MKYYEISVSTEIKETGKYPQVDDLLGGGRVYKKANAKNFATISKWNEETVLPDFSLFVLNRKAKITDFLSSSFNMPDNDTLCKQRFNLSTEIFTELSNQITTYFKNNNLDSLGQNNNDIIFTEIDFFFHNIY